MQINKIQGNAKFNYQQNTSFKSAKISHIALKNLEKVKSNPKSNDLFIKLASVVGLTAILSWVKSLSDKNNKEEIDKLDIIDTAWSDKNNILLLGNNTKDKYLDIIAKADETESILWTKALLANNAEQTNITTPSDESQELFLSKESNETFMTVSANKTIQTIMMQINALNSADEETREGFIKNLSNKLNGLIKEAENIQNNPKSSEIYSKLANIAKIFTLYNIFNNENSNNEDSVETSDIQRIENPVTTQTEDNVQEENETENIIEKSLDNVENKKEQENNSISATTTPLSNNLEKIQIPDEMKPTLNIIGKIDLKEDGKSRFRHPEQNKVPPVINEPLGKIVTTEQNKEFVEQAFLKAFKKGSPIPPEIYCEHIDKIKMIYDSYSNEKDLLKKNLLLRMSEYDVRPVIDKYFKFTNGKIEKFDFLNFFKLEEFKEANGGEVTQKEFDLINNSRNDIIKYFTLINDRAEIAFNIGVSTEKRLQFIKDFHKIAYNIDSNKLFHGMNPEEITVNDIICELSYKLAQDSYQYPNIIRYLGINLDELPESTNEEIVDVNIDEKFSEELKDSAEYIKEILCHTKYRARLKDLAEILNNKSFDGIMNSTHAKMRFIERIVFHDSRLLSKKAAEIKQKTDMRIDKLKNSIEGIEKIKFINYPAKDASKKTQRFGPRIFIKDYTVGLNDKAEIHTIWDE